MVSKQWDHLALWQCQCIPVFHIAVLSQTVKCITEVFMGSGRTPFQNQDYEETLKRFSCRLKLTPLSRFHASGVSLFSLCNYKTQFFFISTLQRRNTVASWDVYSWGKRKTLYSFGKWTYLDPVSVFRSKERRLGQRGKNIVIVPGAARNDPARETWNFTEIQPRNILIDVWT